MENIWINIMYLHVNNKHAETLSYILLNREIVCQKHYNIYYIVTLTVIWNLPIMSFVRYCKHECKAIQNHTL